MNHLQISTDPTLLAADLPESLTTSPSVSTFLPEEDASTCLLLPGTPSPPLDFTHPLTPLEMANVDNCDTVAGDDPAAETSSSGSSGIGMVGGCTSGAGNLFSDYQHLRKTSDGKLPENGLHMNGTLNIPISKDMPSFVHWNWPLIRKCTFFVFLSGIVAMIGIVVTMIATLPKSCNPDVAWYKGSVFYEVFPASFQDTNDDGLGDIHGLIGRVEYFKSLGISAVRLNSIFPSKHYPDHFQDVTSLTAVDEVLGKVEDLQKLAAMLHERNISLILDLPIYPFVDHLNPPSLDIDHLPNRTDDVPTSEYLRLARSVGMHDQENVITSVIRFWLAKTGVDGFYMKGLEHFHDDPLLLENIKEWKYTLGGDRILMVSKQFIEKVPESIVSHVLKQVDLVDVLLDVSKGAEAIANAVKDVMIDDKIKNGVDRPWVHWSLGGVSERRLSTGLSPNATLAATLMQLMLPGTASIFYGDEIALEEASDPNGEHVETQHLHHLAAMAWSGDQFTGRGTLPWLPKSASVSFHHLDIVLEMIALRKKSPSIYLNAVTKDGQTLTNTDIKSSQNDIVVIERWYPRRNSFAAISNLGSKNVSLDLTAMFYSGEIVAGTTGIRERVYFERFAVNALETVIVRLHK